MTAPADTWPMPLRIAFRFAFVYLGLCLLAFPVQFFFSGDYARDVLSDAYDGVLEWMIGAADWLGKQVLSGPHATPAGGSDSWEFYVGFALVALVSTAVWSVLDRRRQDYRTLHQWFRLVIRWSLGFTLIWYGVVKITQDQFNPATLSLHRLMTPVGGLSPAALLWATMTYGYGYAVFAGVVELAAGLLLFWRRTATAGALLAIGAIANVLVLNIVYGVHLKTSSLHLLLMAGFLLLPDARRIFKAVVLGRAVPGVQWQPLVADARRRWLGYLAGLLLVAHGVYTSFDPINWYQERRRDQSLASPLSGAYEVESSSRGSQEVAALLEEKLRWRYFLVENTGYATAWTLAGSVSDFLTSVDTSGGTIRLFLPPIGGEGSAFPEYGTTPRYDWHYWRVGSYQATLKRVTGVPEAEYGRLTYARLPGDRIELNGRLGRDSVSVTLQRHDRSDLFLLKWPRRWSVDVEYPPTNIQTLTPSAPWEPAAPTRQ